jgi:Domain of unknown function (DUF4432)
VIASAIESVAAGGWRAIDLRAWGGLDVRLLPDRALDCGEAWFAGVPLAWISPVGESGPLDHRPQGEDWRTNWGGGLVTTCGLRNVGAPSEGYGLHGEISQLPADYELTRGDGELRVTGVVREGPFVLEREWAVRARTGTVTLRDVCRNEGAEAEPAPFLYHVNLGAPLWAPGARLSLPAARVAPRDEDAAAHMEWGEPPGEASGRERVYEHVEPSGEAIVARDGLTVRVRWSLDTLPRVWQWVDPSLGSLGIEPANCSVLGRAHDRAEGRLPLLAPGEERVTWLEIQASSTSKETSSE